MSVGVCVQVWVGCFNYQPNNYLSLNTFPGWLGLAEYSKGKMVGRVEGGVRGGWEPLLG